MANGFSSGVYRGLTLMNQFRGQKAAREQQAYQRQIDARRMGHEEARIGIAARDLQLREQENMRKQETFELDKQNIRANLEGIRLDNEKKDYDLKVARDARAVGKAWYAARRGDLSGFTPEEADHILEVAVPNIKDYGNVDDVDVGEGGNAIIKFKNGKTETVPIKDIMRNVGAAKAVFNEQAAAMYAQGDDTLLQQVWEQEAQEAEREQGVKPTADMKNIEYLTEEVGWSKEEAAKAVLGMTEGGYDVGDVVNVMKIIKDNPASISMSPDEMMETALSQTDTIQQKIANKNNKGGGPQAGLSAPRQQQRQSPYTSEQEQALQSAGYTLGDDGLYYDEEGNAVAP